MQKSRHVMVVILHAVPFPDQVADHRSSPHPRVVPSSNRAVLDYPCQLRLLLFVQPSLGPRRLDRLQPSGAFRFIPVEPPVNRASPSIQFFADCDDSLAGQEVLQRPCSGATPSGCPAPSPAQTDDPPSALPCFPCATNRTDFSTLAHFRLSQ